MNRVFSLARTSLLFAAAFVFAYVLPVQASARPPAQEVDCQLQVLYCPTTGVSFRCIGDCAPFNATCVLKNIGTWLYCVCEDPDGAGPRRFANCSLFIDTATFNWICGDFGCQGTCRLTPTPLPNGCFEFRCICL
ncbi:MAG: hypothetical protein CMJ89_12310 [Planctomycetes bacterium]|jgi:hypothetical protein|nr:hypothetical protein [Planctomycetota bacterium]